MTEQQPTRSESTDAAELRRKAEERLRTEQATRRGARSEADALALVHELEVHQIELQMQNEELMQARLEVQKTLERYYDLFDFAPVGYFLWDQEGRILEVNLAGAGLLGLDRRMASRMRFAQFVALESRREFADFLKRVLANEVMQSCEIKLLRDSSWSWMLVKGVASEGGPEAQRVCRAAVIDITQQKRADELAAANAALEAEITTRKQAQEDLRSAMVSAERAKSVAEHANNAKDYFLAVLSHELRTPLTPVVMGVSMLETRPDLEPAVREILEMIHRNVQLEARLIDDLLDVSRIARGRIKLARRPVDVWTAIHQAVEVCKPEIEERMLHFGVDRGPNGSYVVEADSARLQQVFWNLVENAVKFTPPNGCVGIRCQPDDDYVLIEVTDSGVGLEPDELPRIFNAFEQGERSSTRQFGGLGLGLAICKALVEMHDGTISAHSEGRGKGTTFRVRLPLAARAGRSDRSADAGSEQRPATALRILLVEDHPATAMMMSKVLSEEGYTVEIVGDVATGLEVACQSSHDLLLSDLGLPDGSGHDLLRALRQRGITFPGIALSGYGQEDDIRRSREAGFDIHLTKPASREAMLEAIDAIAAKHGLCRS